jgi:hypothetical protein
MGEPLMDVLRIYCIIAEIYANYFLLNLIGEPRLSGERPCGWRDGNDYVA